MKPYGILVLMLVLTLFPSQVIASDTIEKTFCTQAVGYKNLDDLKTDLLTNVKRLAVNELFGELITASTAVENFVVTSDQIRTSSIGFVRLEGAIDYHNGTNLAEVCVTIRAYATEQDREKFKPIKLSKRNCVTNQALTTREITDFAKEEAIVQALLDYDRKLEGKERNKLLRLMQRITYVESGFIPDTETFCVRVEGYIVPVEIEAFQAINDSSSASKIEDNNVTTSTNLGGNTLPDSKLNFGETWTKDGIQITLLDYRLAVNQLLLNWQVKNTTSTDVYIRYFNENFTAFDNNNRAMQVSGFVGCNPLSKTFAPGESFVSGDSNGCPLTIAVNFDDPSIREVNVVVRGISKIIKATWRIPIDLQPREKLNVGETWKEDGIELTLESYRPAANQLLLSWQVKNATSTSVQIRYFNENFTAFDNNNRSMRVNGFVGCNALNKTFGPSESFASGDSNGCPLAIEFDPADTSVTEVTVVVTGISRIEKAIWRIPLN